MSWWRRWRHYWRARAVRRIMRDPAEAARAALEELDVQLASLNHALAWHETEQRRLTDARVQACETARQMERRARVAVCRGEETLAREALARVLQAEEEMRHAEELLAAHNARMRETHAVRRALDTRRRDLEHHLHLLALTPDAATEARLNSLLSLADEQVRHRTERHRAARELGDEGLSRRIAALEGGDDQLEQRLAALHAELSPPAIDQHRRAGENLL